MDRSINAGFYQFAPTLGKPEYAIERINSILPDLSGAEIIVLPELANSGYNFNSVEEAFQFAEPIDKSEYVNYLTEKARQYKLFFVSGFNEREDDKIYNSAILVGPEGIMGKYRKIHLFMNEKDYFSKGDLGLPVFDMGDYKLGILICFDYLFPEAWRILGIKGADLVCHPSNLVTPYAQKVVPSHGIVNRYFIITANRIGQERDLTFTGQSMITDPDGNILHKASTNNEELQHLRLDISLSRNKMITPRNHVFNDRLPEQYNELTC